MAPWKAKFTKLIRALERSAVITMEIEPAIED